MLDLISGARILCNSAVGICYIRYSGWSAHDGHIYGFYIQRLYQRKFAQKSQILSLPTHFLFLSFCTSLPLIFQILSLFFRTHTFEPIISHLLFFLLRLRPPLVHLFVVICFSDFLLFFVARGFNLAPHLGPEVRVLG